VSELPSYPRDASEREEAQAPPVSESDARYSGWWRRGGALFIDNILLLVPAAGFFALVFVPNDVVAGLAALFAFFFWLVFPFIYFTYCHGKWGQTIGKRALRIRVRHGERDEILSYGSSFGRYAIVFVFGLFTIPLLLDYLFPLWDRRNQSLHDKVASSIVVRA
jgi:uncharacterized RDD family membrane protein YckC